MGTRWQEKGVGFLSRRGTSQKKPVAREDDGTRGGYHVEHWDGRQDAVVEARTLRFKGSVKEVSVGE